MKTTRKTLQIFGTPCSIQYFEYKVVVPILKEMRVRNIEQRTKDIMREFEFRLHVIATKQSVEKSLLIKKKGEIVYPNYFLFNEYGLNLKIECKEDNGVYSFNIVEIRYSVSK